MPDELPITEVPPAEIPPAAGPAMPTDPPKKKRKLSKGLRDYQRQKKLGQVQPKKQGGLTWLFFLIPLVLVGLVLGVARYRKGGQDGR